MKSDRKRIERNKQLATMLDKWPFTQRKLSFQLENSSEFDSRLALATFFLRCALFADSAQHAAARLPTGSATPDSSRDAARAYRVAFHERPGEEPRDPERARRFAASLNEFWD